MKKTIAVICLTLVIISCNEKAKEAWTLTEADKQAIEKAKREIPLTLANNGWEAYTKAFTDDYQNWAMLGDAIREREDFFPLVKEWYEAGNRAIGSEVETIGFITVAPKKVLYLHKQTEVFKYVDRVDTVSRDIRFVTLYEKEGEDWKVRFTAFMDEPKKD